MHALSIADAWFSKRSASPADTISYRPALGPAVSFDRKAAVSAPAVRSGRLFAAATGAEPIRHGPGMASSRVVASDGNGRGRAD
jgi:hypothetical protein